MRRRRALALVSAAALAVAVPTFASQAAGPPQSVTVSSSPGQNASVAWSGTIPATSTHPTSTCNNGAADPTVDVEMITVNAPPGVYNSVTATFTFSITWKPSSPDETTSDEILTVVDPNGNEVGSSDGGSTTETVTATDLQPGDYMVEACGFVNALPQPYNGKLTLTTVARNSVPSVPPGPANGLAFSASVASDPQRDEAEPLIETAPDGKTYTCGPTGFSNASDYAQVSTDGGNQFHLLGTPPRGQQAVGGGGDCAINLAPDKNLTGNYQYAYAGLGPLTGFTTSTSPDNGHSLTSLGPQDNGFQSTGALADRQWVVFLDKDSSLLSYNQQVPRNIVVQRSDNGGLIYGPITAVGGAAPDFPGPMRTLPAKFNTKNPSIRPVYFGWSQGTHANLSISYDGGGTFVDCVAAIEPGQPRAGFVTVDNDTAGNIYLAYSDKAQFHTYLVTLPQNRLSGCSQEITPGGNNEPLMAVPPKNDPQAVGWSTPLQVDRGNVRTSLFSWLAAGGAPGRVAVTFYGTETEGDPNLGSFKASWNVYVNQSVNALTSGSRTFSQVKATTHPIHYDSICLNGLGCAVTGGDRSLGDFFAIKTNPATGRLQVVYNNDNKKPGEAAGHVGSPMVFTQIGGPNTKGGTVSGGNTPVVRPASADPTLDAIANYSGLIAPPPPAMTNEPASDLRLLSIDPPSGTGGGFNVSMTLASLSSTDVAKALRDTKSQSLLYVLRFSNGYQVSAVTARTTDGINFTYTYNDYDTLLTECSAGSSDDKCLSFGQTGTSIQGSVSGNTITMTVPLKYAAGGARLKQLVGGQGDQQRPRQVLASSGSRFYDATAFTFGDIFPTESSVLPQTYLSTLDNTPAMDFKLP
jgi:hypothetical protein